TKKDYNGFEVGGRFGLPTRGPDEQAWQYKAYIVGGASTENTRFTMGAELYEQNALETKARNFAALTPDQLVARGVVPDVAYLSPSYPGKVQSDPVYDPNNIGSDGSPALISGGQSYILSGSPFAPAGAATHYTTPPVLHGQTF